MLVRWGVVAALTCVFLVCEPSAFADGDTQPKVAAAKYKEARALFRSGEYDEALAAAEAGLNALPSHTKLRLLQGQILLEKRDYDGALAAYESFLAAGPRGANKRKAKKIIRNLAVVRTTFLVVTAEPGPANVYVDSTTMGVICVAEPTCKKGFVPGTYQVIIERPGFDLVRERVTIVKGQVTEVTKTLVEKPSQLVVTATPAEADVKIDDQPAVSGTAQEVQAGEHKVEVSLTGYATHTETVKAAEGRPIELPVVLAELLVVEVKPPDAELLLDGKAVKRVDGAIILPKGATGPFQITARKAGYREKIVDVPAERDKTAPVPIELQQLPKVLEPDPDPDPIRPHKEWTIPKISLVSAGGAVALTGFAIAGISAGNASGFQSDAERLCVPDELGLVCDTQEGFEATVEAKDSASVSNVMFGVGVVGTIGALVAYNYNEPPTKDGGLSTRRKVSIGVTAGIAALAFTGSVLSGLAAQESWDEAEQFCDADGLCDRRGAIAGSEAEESAVVANVSFVVGSVAAASAVYLWLFAPATARAVEEDVSVGASVIPGGGGITVRARF